MATNIPPHNLREVIDACVVVLDNPDAGLPELMACIKGPDFPTKGIIMGRSGIRAAYATGRGKITVRARTEFEEFGHDRTRIIVTELPYQVNKRLLISAIADQVKEKRIEGISDLRDESDRSGMRIVIELKKDANPQVVLNCLLSQTQLQTTFSINMLALVDNQSQPRILSLRHILDHYLEFQEELIVRRTRYDLKKALERAHLLEGLLIAQNNIDEVVHIIRESYDNAKERLCERFGLDDIQAQAILEMRLRQLQGLDREKLETEYRDLEARIAYYNELLADPAKIRGVLRDELLQIREKYGDERKTEIQDVENEIDIEDLIPEKSCVITMTRYGYIKRMVLDEYRAQKRGGRGVRGMTQREEDFVTTMFVSSTHDNIIFFTDRGRIYRLKGYEIPESSRSAKGTNVINLLPLDSGETVTAAIRGVPVFDEGHYLCMVTKNGVIKRTAMAEFKNLRKSGLIAISLDEGDSLEFVRMTNGSDELIVATRFGRAIRFAETDVRPMGRAARGVRAVMLGEGDCVVGLAAVREGELLLTVSEGGMGRRTPFADYPIRSRGGKGVLNYYTEKGGMVAGVKSVSEKDDVILISDDGVVIRIPSEDVSQQSRYGGGVRVMRLAEGTRVVTLAAVEREDEVAPDSDEAPNAQDTADSPAPENPESPENVEDIENPEE
jgi:DNA gyrase subunit A